MHKVRINFLLFVCLNISVFLYPMVLKTLHVHKQTYTYHAPQSSEGLTKTEKSCQICQFDFVNVILAKPLPTLFILSPLEFLYLLPQGRVWKTTVFYFSLRAPPVA